MEPDPVITGSDLTSLLIVRRQSVLVQEELLYTPVVHVRDDERILIATGDPVNPVELARGATRLTQPPQDLAIQRHLVDSPRVLI